jgi:hypothetical protein
VGTQSFLFAHTKVKFASFGVGGHRMFLSITKARVQGIDKDVTKTGNDRRIELCPRAITVLERQLRLRERLVKTGHIDHECLFFTQTSAPIRDLVYPYSRWRRTLQRLAIRYRKPYAARHSSVSWDLMLGRNPLWVAKQHGHSIATMLWVYAAWIKGTSETDLLTLQEAMNGVRQNSPAEPASPPTGSLTDYGISTSHPGTASAALAAAPALPRTLDATLATAPDTVASGLDPDARSPRELGTGLVTSPKEAPRKTLNARKKSWRRGWDSNPRAGITRPSDFESAPL